MNQKMKFTKFYKQMWKSENILINKIRDNQSILENQKLRKYEQNHKQNIFLRFLK